MKVAQGQTLIDIAIQECGSAESAIDIAVANGISVTDELTPGTELIIPSIKSKAVVDYYDNHGIKAATQITEMPGTTIFDETFDETFE